MKKIGLIGGISWISTVDYYKYINEGVNKALGGMNFAECIIYSFNYGDIKRNNDAEDWDKTADMLSAAGEHLKAAGASFLLLCANTMHMVAEQVEARVKLPVLHIAAVTADDIVAKGLKKVALLGTKFTMERDFFTSRLKERGIEALIPTPDDRQFIQDTIYYELGKGIFTPATRERYLTIIAELIDNGAEGVVLGCTEIPMIIKSGDVPVPVFDTVMLHAAAAVKLAVE